MFPENDVSEPVAEPQRSETVYAMWMYIVVLLACVVGVCLAPATYGTSLVGAPLLAALLWLTRRSSSPFVDAHGREAFSIVITILLVPIPGIIGGPFVFLVIAGGTALLGLISFVAGAVLAAQGKPFRAPLMRLEPRRPRK